MTTRHIDPYNFSVFVAVWNKLQHQTTPYVHFKLTHWLERMHEDEQKRLLLQAFRGCGKSTLTGLYAAWHLFRWPDSRILVIAAEEALAQKMVRNIRRIIEQHPLSKHLKPEKAEQWGADRFTVVRNMELRDPSVLGRGILGNMTGCRADVIICDDVEVPNTAATPGKREELRQRLREIDFILVPDGRILYIGTPHSYHSIYTYKPAADHEDERAFLQDYTRLKLPVYNRRGQSAWPERFTLEAIEMSRRQVGPNQFASQMMLQPVNYHDGHLETDRIDVYDGALSYIKELYRLEINNRQMMGAAAWWDPAFGEKSGDRSVLAVVFTDEQGHYWLQHLDILSADYGEEDQARVQCRHIAQSLKALHVPSISVEINGLGRFLPGILREILIKQRVPCSVLEVTSRKPKDERIMEAFDVVLAAEMLHVHREVMNTPFATELKEWRPGANKGHDDCLDAVAGAMSAQPARIGGGPAIGRQTWQRGSRAHNANTDFKI